MEKCHMCIHMAVVFLDDQNGSQEEVELSGAEAFQKYIDHTLPFLKESGGDVVFLGGRYLIGPQEEHWDFVMLIRQNSLSDFLAFSSNQDYLAGLGHRTAALEDSRLLPIVESATAT